MFKLYSQTYAKLTFISNLGKKSCSQLEIGKIGIYEWEKCLDKMMMLYEEKEKVIGERIFFLNLGYSFSNWDISFYLHEVDNKIL